MRRRWVMMFLIMTQAATAWALISENARQAPASTVSVLPTEAPNADDIEFDSDFLRGKGFRNMSNAELKKLGNVRPGPLTVDIYRNGTSMGKSSVLFTTPPGEENGNAKPCITRELFMQLNVKPSAVSTQGMAALSPPDAESATQDAKTCLYLEDWVNGASADFDKSALQLKLSIPQAYLTRQSNASVSTSMLTRGDNAGFVNYNFNHYQAQGNTSDYLGLNSGLNLDGWQLRHSSFLTQGDSTNGQSAHQYTSGETFVRRPLIDWKSSLALGDTNSFSPIIGGVPLRGLRLSSEEGMMSDDERSYRPVVRGIARTNARVRVMQNNVVFFEQTVPPGPFELNDINPPAALGDLEVIVTEADGGQQNFVEPYSLSAGKLSPGSLRYSTSAGNYRPNATSVNHAAVLQAYVRYGLNKWVSPGVELLMASNYQNLGLQTTFNNPWGGLTLNSLYAQTKELASNSTGQAFNVNYTAPAMGPFQFYGGLSEQSRAYVAPNTALTGMPFDVNGSYNFKSSRYFSLSLNMRSYGGVSLSMVDQNTWATNSQSRQRRASYFTNWQRINLNAYLSQSNFADGNKSTSSVGFSIAIPLESSGKLGSVSASYTQSDQSDATRSLSYSGSMGPNNTAYYNLNHSQTGADNSSGGSLNYAHPWGNLGGNLSSSSSGAVQTGLSASGSVVLHRDGVIMAPPLGGTFAIVEVPQGEGVRLQGGNARINQRGYGVVTNLSPYYLNDVQISLEGASVDLDIDNAGQKVAPVEGAIVRLKFDTTVGRPLLLRLSTSSGERIPIGANVTNSQGVDVGIVGQGSRALVRVKTPRDKLNVVWGENANEHCTTQYALDEKIPSNASGFTPLQLMCAVGSDANDLLTRSPP